MSAVVVPPSLIAAIDGALTESLAAIGMKHETLAALMGISLTQLSQERRGVGQLGIARLLLARTDIDGRQFLAHFLPRLAALAGVEELDAVAAQLHRLADYVDDRRRQVKADLRPALATRRTA